MTRPATFTPEVKQGILWRDGNLCAMAGFWSGCLGTADHHPNHRLGRGMGGSTSETINTPANGCGLCAPCNVGIESDADVREEACRRGVKLERGQDPETTPLWSPFFRQWIVPASDGAWLTGVVDAGLDARDSSWLPVEVLA